MYGKIQVTIKGQSALLMNRLHEDALESKTRKIGKTYDKEVEAKKSAYITEIDGKEQLYIPAYAIYSMIVRTATRYTVPKLGRLSSILAGTIRIEPEEIGLGHCDYEIDVRPVVIQRARVLKARAKIPEWKAKFTIIYNKKALEGMDANTLKEVLEDGGTRMGLLDYRPQHKGWFGTFEVTKYEVVD